MDYYVPNPMAKLAFDRTEVEIIVVNGFHIRGEIIAWSDDCIVLSVEGKQQIVFTQNVSTIIPSKPVELKNDREDD